MSKRERKKGKRNKQKVLWERERNTEKTKKYSRKEKEKRAKELKIRNK